MVSNTSPYLRFGTTGSLGNGFPDIPDLKNSDSKCFLELSVQVVRLKNPQISSHHPTPMSPYARPDPSEPSFARPKQAVFTAPQFRPTRLGRPGTNIDIQSNPNTTRLGRPAGFSMPTSWFCLRSWGIHPDGVSEKSPVSNARTLTPETTTQLVNQVPVTSRLDLETPKRLSVCRVVCDL